MNFNYNMMFHRSAKIAFSALIFCWSLIASAQGINVEKTMRAIQVRSKYVASLPLVAWPTRQDGMCAPEYPPDDFYDEDMKIPEAAARIVSVMARNDDRATSMWNTYGRAEFEQDPENLTVVSDIVPAVDPLSVTADNYSIKLEVIHQRGMLARSVWRSATITDGTMFDEDFEGTYSEYSGWISPRPSAPFPNGGAARSVAAANFMGAQMVPQPWWWTQMIGHFTRDQIVQDFREVFPFGEEPYAEYRYRSFAAMVAWIGKVQVDLGPAPATAHIFLTLGPYNASAIANPLNAPIPQVDSSPHFWRSVSGTGVWKSEAIPSKSAVWPALENDEDHLNLDIIQGWVSSGGPVLLEPVIQTPADPVPCPQLCQAGTVNYSLDGAALSIGLSDSASDRTAGYLFLREQNPSSRLDTPEVLKVATGGTVIRDSSDVIRQVFHPGVLADVAIVSPKKWEVRIFKGASNIGPQVDGLFDQTGKTPFHTITFESRWSGDDFTGFVVAETGQLRVHGREYRWVLANGKRLWKLVTDDPLYGVVQNEESITGQFDAQGIAIKERLVKAADELLLSHVVSTYKIYSWGEEEVSRLDKGINSSGQYTGHDKSTLSEFYEISNASLGAYKGLLRMRSEEGGGGWEHYEYDTQGRVSKVRSQYLDEAMSVGEDLNSRVSVYAYSDQDVNNDGIADGVVSKTELIQGTPVRRSFIVKLGSTFYTPTYSYCEEWDVVSTSPIAESISSVLLSAQCLITKKRYESVGSHYSPFKMLVYPNGTIALSEVDGSTHTLSVGVPNVDASAIVDGTRTVQSFDSVGLLMKEEVFDSESGLQLEKREVVSRDAAGRATAYVYIDGSSSSLEYDCCGLIRETDRQGVSTSYVRDRLGRICEETRAGVKLKYTLDNLGRTLKVERIAGGEAMTVVINKYGSHGLQSSIDPMGRETSVDMVFMPLTGYIKTTSLPGGGSSVEKHYISGLPKSNEGTAVRPLKFEYGVDNDSIFIKEIRLGSTGEETEWTESYTDFAGRTYKVVHPDGAFSQSFYNPLGQLVRQVDADGVTTLYAYNAQGEAEVTALDLNRNGVIDYTGGDRIIRTRTSVLTAHSMTVHRTTQEIWETDSADTPRTVSTTEASVDGLRSWQVANSQTSSTQTVYPGSGIRQETATLPDGVQFIRQYMSDRLLSATTYQPTLGTFASTTYAYDAHGRLQTTTDARTGATQYTYFADDQVKTVTTPDPDTSRTGPGYDPQTTTHSYDAAGRLWTIIHPDSSVVTNEYYPTGQLKKTSGSRTYPQEYTYDAQGRAKTLKTWQNYATATGAALTTWNYDAARGWLLNKRYQDNAGPSYLYTPAGRLQKRTWARLVASAPLTATYAYDNAGTLSGIDYSDTTPDVALTYDRLGRIRTQSDAAGTLTRAYHPSGQLQNESYGAGGLLDAATLMRTFDALDRLSGLTASGAPATTYGYDPASRLQTVTTGANSVTYGYLANSNLVETVAFKSGTTPRLTTTKTYDKLNRLTSLAHARNAQPASTSFGYAYNSANQRTQLTREDAGRWDFDYDALGQVISGVKKLSDGTTIPGHDYAYTYDDIGNRKTATTNSQTSTFTATLLNQYSQRTIPGVLDVVGAVAADATVTVTAPATGGTIYPTMRQGEAFYRQLTVANSTLPQNPAIKITGVKNNVGPGGEDAVTEITKTAFVAKTPELFTHDLDGNLTADGKWTYAWDAENRLTAMETQPAAVTAGVAKQKLTFAYDASGRRVQKKVFTWNGTVYVAASDLRFVYDGWNLVAELDALAGNAPVRTYAWGLDLSGSMKRAGGVGGLLAITSGTATHFPSYDGNGNILALSDSTTGALTASYDYGPFGELLRTTGPAADANPFRFSTKYEDPETGLLYYGFRYYNPQTGRWPSRDPIQERGGLNLYGMIGNDAINGVDFLGLRGNSGGQKGDPAARAALELYFRIADKLAEAKRECSCYKSIVDRIDSLREKFFAGNKNFNKVINDVQGNFGTVKDFYSKPIEYTGDAIRFREEILEGVFGFKRPHDAASVEQFEAFKDSIAYSQTAKWASRASTGLNVAESLSRSDAVDLTLTVFDALPLDYFAFGPGYFKEAYRGVLSQMSNIAPDLFDRRADELIIGCAGGDGEEMSSNRLRILEREAFQKFLNR